MKSVSGRTCTDSGGDWGAKVSQTGLRGLSGVFPRAVKGPHRYDEGIFNSHLLLDARNGNPSYEDRAKNAPGGCGGTFNFFGERGSRVVELGAEAVTALLIFRKKYSEKGEKVSAELLVDGCSVQRGGCEVHRPQRDLFVE